MSWIKICGLTSAAAVAAALEVRADAIGFVFAPSPRRVDPRTAARLAAPARGRLELVAVTRAPTQELIDAVLAELAPDALQADFADLAQLTLPRGLALLPVLRARAPLPEALPARTLVEGARSGSGEPWDWAAARGLAHRTQLVLAGGLGIASVARAIATVRPYGVDVSSGVEEAPGIKSAVKIQAFAAAARAAFEALDAAPAT